MKLVRHQEVSYQPASHEDPRSPGVLKKVMATTGQLSQGKVQMINWARLEPAKSFEAHYHQDMEEVFIIVSGSPQMSIDKHRLTLARGDMVLVQEGEIHQMTNPTDQVVEYVVVGISRQTGGQTINAPLPT